jgi:hypothetical protein
MDLLCCRTRRNRADSPRHRWERKKERRKQMERWKKRCLKLKVRFGDGRRESDGEKEKEMFEAKGKIW